MCRLSNCQRMLIERRVLNLEYFSKAGGDIPGKCRTGLNRFPALSLRQIQILCHRKLICPDWVTFPRGSNWKSVFYLRIRTKRRNFAKTKKWLKYST